MGKMSLNVSHVQILLETLAERIVSSEKEIALVKAEAVGRIAALEERVRENASKGVRLQDWEGLVLEYDKAKVEIRELTKKLSLRAKRRSTK